MNDQVFNEISDFMEDYKWYLDGKEMTRETSIEKDFGITGDDAAEFLDAFVKRFNINDYSEFEFDDYFEGEGFDLFAIFRQKREKKVLTVGDLERAVETGILK